MRWLAIGVNLAQIFIILGLFLTRGLTLGGATILVLFLLLLFALINLIVLLFYAIHTASDMSIFGRDKGPIVKRQDLRVIYLTEPRPVLNTGKHRFPIFDLAENGVRIGLDRNLRYRKHLRGRIELLTGESYEVKAVIIRREGDEAALLFKNPIDYEVLLQERKTVQAAGYPDHSKTADS